MVAFASDREICLGCGKPLSSGGVHYWQRARVCGDCKRDLEEGVEREERARNQPTAADRLFAGLVSLWCLVLAGLWLVAWRFG